ncbi:unnamed protein product [Cylindrotheca closterium]|uniref:ER membrane protein complex subunit 10 n=1 Tax=Cylindrotheca closterium TaxID=2856 RepID=A0AAD2G429_9STRA|nr:unnamed protein product [Cylindrotheca closterium]
MLMPSSMFVFLISVLLLGSIVQVSSSTWTVYHSFNADQEFSRRGELKWSPEEGALQITNEESALSTESIQAMLDYGWYHVKIQNPNDTNDFVLSTVPACSIRRANFKDEFQVTLPRTQESQITSLAYLPLASPLAPKSCDEMGEVESPTFTSKVSLTLDTPGMILKSVLPTTKPPPGMTFIPHPNLKKNSGNSAAGDGAKGGAKEGQIPGQEEEEPQSYIRKYWYIFLPLMIANFMGIGSPAAGGEPSQGGAGDAQPAVAAAGASAPAGSDGGKRRRGKRR